MTLIQQPVALERLQVGSVSGRVLQSEQLARYRWAAQATSGKEVLDAGCGAGLGTRILAEAGAERVTGVEPLEETVAEALRQAGDVAQLVAGDLAALPFAPSSFDVAVCFDVVERVEQVGQLLDELHRVLREDGILLISLPGPPGSRGGLERELRSRFPEVVLHRQHSGLASAILSEDLTETGAAPSARLTASPDAAPAPITLAVAGRRETPDLEDLVVLAEAFEVQRWEGEVTRARREADVALRRVEEARGREEHAASERQLIAQRLIEAEQLTGQAQARALSLQEEIGRQREQRVSREAVVAALRLAVSRTTAAVGRAAKTLLGARR